MAALQPGPWLRERSSPSACGASAFLCMQPSEEPEAQARAAAFLQGLQETGWAVGRNVRIDIRWSAGDVGAITKDATELVALGPDVLLAGVGATIPALREATHTIPIVFAQGLDPVGAGFAESGPPGRQRYWFYPVRIQFERKMV